MQLLSSSRLRGVTHCILSFLSINVLIGTTADAAIAQQISILFGGDTSYGESYQQEYALAGGVDVVASNGYDYSIRNLDRLLKKCQLNIVNLETPLTTIRERSLEGKSYYHYSDPVFATAALRKHKIHAVSLANNHVLDYGTAGMDETLKSIQLEGIEWFGAGRNRKSAEKPFFKRFEHRGNAFEIAVLGVFRSHEFHERNNLYAGNENGGTCRLEIARLSKQIKDLKRKHPQVFVVVFPHWGANYVWRTEHQQSVARKAIDAGADLIIGHGAHRLQEIEYYRDRWIFYSIGNFMFNSRGRFAKLSSPPYSMPLVLHVNFKGGDHVEKRIQLYPIMSDNTKTNYQPRFVNQEEFQEVFQLLTKHSAEVSLAEQMKLGADDIGHYFELEINSSK